MIGITKKNLFLGFFLGQNKKGFTLLELLVVIFITATLAALLLANYRGGQKRYALAQAAQQLVSDIRRAQNMAISGVDIQSRYCGYGIKVNGATSYFLYGDTPPSGDPNNCVSLSNHQYDGSDKKLETIYLPDNIVVQSTSPAAVDIFFKPPEPTTYINGNGGILQGIITLQIEGTSIQKRVTVTTAGRIEAD